jgi:hypothetical protein
MSSSLDVSPSFIQDQRIQWVTKNTRMSKWQAADYTLGSVMELAAYGSRVSGSGATEGAKAGEDQVV